MYRADAEGAGADEPAAAAFGAAARERRLLLPACLSEDNLSRLLGWWQLAWKLFLSNIWP